MESCDKNGTRHKEGLLKALMDDRIDIITDHSSYWKRIEVENVPSCYLMTNRGYEGYFADLTLVDLNSQWTVKENLVQMWSPLGHHFNTKVQTL
jgi:dihydroorotase-like cyclic amidohydrolase